MIYSDAFNRRMRDIFFEDLSHSRKITKTEWKGRPFHKKLIEALVRLFSPIL